MKKTISLIFAALMLVLVLSACGEEDIKSDDKNPTASVTAQDAETSSDSETDTTASETKKNESNSKDSKTDGKSNKKGDTGSSKVTTTTSTTSTTTTLPEEPVINELPGEKLASNVGFNKNLSSFDLGSNLRGNILIAKTYEEFKNIYDDDIGKFPDKYKDYDSFNEEDNYILKYDEDFFQENALIAVFSYEPSGSNRVKIDGVSKKDGELFVGVISEVPGPGYLGTCDAAYWRTLIEVKKTDIADITKITRIKSEAWK